MTRCCGRGAARRRATGADFSAEAIALARQLNEELGLDAEFACSDVYDLPQRLEGSFDVVYTSHGVLCWLPDLPCWAAVAAHFLAEGGVFYIAEQHPLASTLGEEEGRLLVADAYFDTGAHVYTGGGTYAVPDATFEHDTTYEWQHSLGDVVSAVAAAGLRIEFLHEHPFAGWRQLPSLERGEDGRWHLPGRDDVPLLFTLRARKG